MKKELQKFYILNTYLIGMIFIEYIDKIAETPIYMQNLKMVGKKFLGLLEKHVDTQIVNIQSQSSEDYHEISKIYIDLSKKITSKTPEELSEIEQLINHYENDREGLIKKLQG